MLGLGSRARRRRTIRRGSVINLPSEAQVTHVDRLAMTTGRDPVPEEGGVGYRHEREKFATAGPRRCRRSTYSLRASTNVRQMDRNDVRLFGKNVSANAFEVHIVKLRRRVVADRRSSAHIDPVMAAAVHDVLPLLRHGDECTVASRRVKLHEVDRRRPRYRSSRGQEERSEEGRRGSKMDNLGQMLNDLRTSVDDGAQLQKRSLPIVLSIAAIPLVSIATIGHSWRP